MKSLFNILLSLLAGILYLPILCLFIVAIGICLVVIVPIGIIILASMYVKYVLINETNKGFIDYISSKKSE